MCETWSRSNLKVYDNGEEDEDWNVNQIPWGFSCYHKYSETKENHSRSRNKTEEDKKRRIKRNIWIVWIGYYLISSCLRNAITFPTVLIAYFTRQRTQGLTYIQ